MNQKFAKIVIATVIFLMTAVTAWSQGDPGAGKQLFKANCASCHKLNEDMTGPALAGVTQRRSNEWLHKWITNSQALIASGDPDANALWEKWKPTPMTAFTTLKSEEIDNILAYITQGETSTASTDPNAGGAQTTVVDGDVVVSYETIYTGLAILIMVLVLLILTFLFMLVNVKNLVRLREGKPSYTIAELVAETGNLLKNKVVVGLGTAVILIVATVWIVNQARSVSLHQGYMPEQPIKFSHKLHAGQNQIDCQYCHTGASKGKNAWIPSTNVCMNCHKYVKKGPKYGETEIKKIHESYNNNEPIKWVRIHTLPDHAYFNHSQHVVVGQIACQTCHGPVEEMEEVYQYAPLSMGWCVNCHRTTKVKVLGKESDMTVEDMGGLSCSRCHY